MLPVYAEEPVWDVWDEVQPLLREHWERVAHFKDIPLDPDRERYFQLQDAGKLMCFTVREKGTLVGYTAFFLTTHIHYQSTLFAMQDVLFHIRGALGLRGLLRFADERLRCAGVQVVTQHYKAAHDLTSMMTRLGYETMDIVAVKRL